MAANRAYFGVRTGVTNTTSAANPLFGITGGTTARVSIYDIISGSDATPADNYAEFAIRRLSTAGTTSATFTPTALDPADPAASAVFATTWSAQPTVTASSDIWSVSQNQRATFRWVAAPGGELLIPATAAAGLGMMAVGSNATATYQFSVYWME